VKRLHQLHSHTEQIFCRDFHHHEMAWYCARVEYLDTRVGRLLDALEDSGQADDTAVIFFADHGDNKGRHGLWGKMNFYQESQCVPLYARVPGVDPRVVRERVSLADLAPTLADLGGCEVTYRMDGQSLAPLLRGERPEDPNAVIFSEYHGYLSPSDMYMVVRGDYKYCHYLREPCELYNLAEDPGEEDNRIDDPSLEPIRAELEAEIRKRVDIERFDERVRDYNDQRRTVAEAIIASADIRQSTAAYIKEFRDRLDEPWWDGGEFISRHEGHLKGETKQRAK